jgi:16S rRNA (guanine966-N2)-methyltransferase
VTRIIGGAAGGRRLQAPPGGGTRPTSDRAREALFSALESLLGTWHGVTLLDLYAGSGAVGLEALSRGAASAVCVEQDRRAALVARRNADSLGLPAEVETRSVAAYLAGRPRGFDVVFLDPPYDLDVTAVRRDLVALTRGWLVPDSVVVLERSTRGRVAEWPEGYQVLRERRYGETVLAYARFGSVAD